MHYVRWFVLMAVAVFVGCGGADVESVTPPQTSPVDEIRAILEPVAAGSDIGSEIGRLMDQITALKESDAALAGELEGDANKMMEQMSNPSQLKATAQTMLDKLK